jgi:hypothetical protein
MLKVSFQTCLLLFKLVYEVPRILLAGDRIDDDACNIALGAIAALRCLPVTAYLPSPAFGACRELRTLGRHAFTYRASQEVITKLFAYARDGTRWRGEVSDIAEVSKLGASALSHTMCPNNPEEAFDHKHLSQTPAKDGHDLQGCSCQFTRPKLQSGTCLHKRLDKVLLSRQHLR